MCRAPLQISLEAAKKVPLCIHCKFYIPPPPVRAGNVDYKRGLCQKTGMIHVVDGEITYKNVEIAREYNCKGTWFQKQIEPPPKYESLDTMSY